jgi:hypothetical protein
MLLSAAKGEARQIIEARRFDAEIVSSVLTDPRFGLIKSPTLGTANKPT